MLDIKVDTAEAEALLNRVADMDAMVRKIANAIADDLVLPALVKAPSPSGKKMQFVSAKQRAYVIWAIKQGIINVPYRRTGDYGRSFEKQPNSTGMSLVSGLSYAPYVRGPGSGGGDPQAAYHKGNWDTLDTLAEQLEPQARDVAEQVIVKEIAGP